MKNKYKVMLHRTKNLLCDRTGYRVIDPDVKNHICDRAGVPVDSVVWAPVAREILSAVVSLHR